LEAPFRIFSLASFVTAMVFPFLLTNKLFFAVNAKVSLSPKILIFEASLSMAAVFFTFQSFPDFSTQTSYHRN
jgi:hypothetical protein